jgi:hypothetical protein
MRQAMAAMGLMADGGWERLPRDASLKLNLLTVFISQPAGQRKSD